MIRRCGSRMCPAGVLAALACGVFAIVARPADGQGEGSAQMEQAKPASPLNFVVKDIDGKAKNLSDYKGKVVLIVNVASKCGFTPQYADLQKLHEKYHEQGLAILGFPANDFGRQEPGTNNQIKQFCTGTYGVQFDMFSKVCVKGGESCELYKFLTSSETDPSFAGPIRWNFTKFLIGRDGNVIARFEPQTKPTSPEVTEAIEKALAAEAPKQTPAAKAADEAK